MSGVQFPADITEFSNDCLACLFEKALAKPEDEEAQYALKLLSVLLGFMACRMLTGNDSDPCAKKAVRILPQEVKVRLLDADPVKMLSTHLDLLISGIVHRIIEDDDWDS